MCQWPQKGRQRPQDRHFSVGDLLALAFTKQFSGRHRELAMPPSCYGGGFFQPFGFLGCHRTDERRMMVFTGESLC